MEQGLEEQRWAERGLRFQVGTGVEVWVVGRLQNLGGVPGNKGALKTTVRRLKLTQVDPSILNSDLVGAS